MFDIIKRSVFAAVLVAATAATSAHATTLVPFTNEDLAHVADVIVVGEVQDVVFEYEGSTLITRNSIRVIESWKGDHTPDSVIDVIVAGGRAPQGGFDLHGSAGFLKKERVVLFLSERVRHSGYLPLGMFQGKFTLFPAGEGKWTISRLTVPMNERGSLFELKKAKPAKFVEGDEASDFGAFATKVKSVVKADREAGVRGKDLPQYRGLGR